MRRTTLLAASLAVLPVVAAQSTSLATEIVVGGLSRPLQVAAPAGDVERLFVVEQKDADIHVVKDGVVLPEPFLDLTGMVAITGGEQGLLGLAFHPDYASNGFFYVNYTQSSNATVVERYTVSATDPDRADPDSAVLILSIAQPELNHNGGHLVFGPDGMLWIGMGDGGNRDDMAMGAPPGGNAQSGATLLGAMLRIDVDGGSPYAIPVDNPYVADPNVEDEIWSLGLRNPWRYGFDRDTGDLWIGDVGQDEVEEIDFVSAETIAAIATGTAPPVNFGWRCMEGFLCTGLGPCTCDAPELTLPLHQVDDSLARAIIGGLVYRGDAIPDLAGAYVFADHVTSRIWTLREDGGALVPGSVIERTAELAPPVGAITRPASIAEGPDGELYIADREAPGGEIHRIVPGGPFTGLGGSLAGTAGPPILFGTGDTASGQPGALHLRDAVPNAPLAILFLALQDNPTPFKGGALHTVPVLAQFALSTDASGGLDVPWTDLGIVGPISLYWQWAIQDPGAVFGASLSNALRMDVP